MSESLVGLVCALGIISLLFSGCAGNSDTDEDRSPTTPDLRIEITRFKEIDAGETGNDHGDKPVIASWYETTNVSDRVSGGNRSGVPATPPDATGPAPSAFTSDAGRLAARMMVSTPRPPVAGHA